MRLQENDWSFLCETLNISGVDRLVACLVGAITYEDHRVELCDFLEKAMWGKRTVWIKYCRKYRNAQRVCICPISSSSLVIS